ncbi:MAG: ABC transporter substrate-binding protein [Oscillospiraceae bacterium]|nr:ABC transporter substrate-binding protein [Oscillospiraceae bacterium]
MKKGICVLLCVASLLGILAGCQNDKGSYKPTGNALSEEDNLAPTAPQTDTGPQELSLIYYKEKTMNPYTCTDFTNRALFSLLYQSLFIVDREYNVEPMLCKQYSVSADMRTYIFYMEAATFSNNTALTDRDVAASLLAAKESPVYAGRFTHVSEVTVLEGGGVQVSLSTPMEELPLLLDVPIVKESHVASDRPLGTGPYMLDETGSSAVLRRQDNWWCTARMTVTANVITLKTATDNAQIRDSFEFENLSLVCADPGSDKYADYRCDYELWDCENNILLYLACNMESEIFSNETVRAALPMSVDRDSIVESFYRGFARSASLPASPLSRCYNDTLASRYSFDGGESLKKAVSDAGFVGKEMILLVNSDDSLRVRVAKEIATVFTEAGLTVTLTSVSTDSYTRALQKGEYDLYLGQTKLSPNMDLSAFFSGSGNLSYGNLGDVALYTMCTEALANYGNFYTLHQNVMSDGRLCPILMRSYAIYAERGLLTGLTPARDSVFYYSLGKSMSKAKIENN